MNIQQFLLECSQRQNNISVLEKTLDLQKKELRASIVVFITPLLCSRCCFDTKTINLVVNDILHNSSSEVQKRFQSQNHADKCLYCLVNMQPLKEEEEDTLMLRLFSIKLRKQTDDDTGLGFFPNEEFPPEEFSFSCQATSQATQMSAQISTQTSNPLCLNSTNSTHTNSTHTNSTHTHSTHTHSTHTHSVGNQIEFTPNFAAQVEPPTNIFQTELHPEHPHVQFTPYPKFLFHSEFTQHPELPHYSQPYVLFPTYYHHHFPPLRSRPPTQRPISNKVLHNTHLNMMTSKQHVSTPKN